MVRRDLAGRTGRLPCPALEGIRERTNLAVAEQPSNLRDRQVPVRKISLGEILAEFLQHFDKRQTLRCKMSGESSLAHAELPCNILRVRFVVRQEWHNGRPSTQMHFGLAFDERVRPRTV